jgi:beta-lactamase regulating signal transducer with metallopeptidase domain
MKNFLKKYPVARIVLIVWIVFATLYVLYGEYSRLKVFVAQQAYTKGVTDSVVELMKQAQTCQPIPVTAGDTQVQLISIDCLQAPEEGGAE